ncbi:MAG: M56 family metallopeptidase [Acidobacteriota bacterium]
MTEWALLIDILIKGSLLLVLGLGLNRVLRRASAASRHVVWSALLTALVMLPLFAVALPSRQLAWLPPAQSTSTANRLAPDGQISAGQAGHNRALAGDELGRAEKIVPRAPSAPVSPRQIVLLWLAGTAVGLLRLGAGMVQLSRLRQGAQDLTHDPVWRDTLATLGRQLSIRRPVHLATHPDVRVPMAWGLFRPRVLLPLAARDFDAEERFDILAHELAHIGRFDWGVHLCTRFTCALYWFHPLVWMAARGLTLEAERACDDRVLLLGSGATSYAERLLDMARRAQPRAGTDPTVAVALLRRSELSRRIAAILDPSIRRTTMKRIQILTCSLLVVFGLAILAPARLVRASESESHLDRVVEGDGTLLIMAAHSGDSEWVRQLLDAGADPDRAATGDGNPLIAAARNGHREIVEILLDAGSDVDAGVPGDGNPLIMAARGGHDEVVELLLDHGADIDHLVLGDETALIRAAGSGHLETVRLLIDRGADVSQSVPSDQDADRAEVRTALGMARRGGHGEVVELLLDHGAID